MELERPLVWYFANQTRRRGDSIAKATADAWRSDAALNVVQRESEKFKRASQDGVDENAMNEFMMLLGKSQIKTQSKNSKGLREWQKRLLRGKK